MTIPEEKQRRKFNEPHLLRKGRLSVLKKHLFFFFRPMKIHSWFRIDKFIHLFHSKAQAFLILVEIPQREMGQGGGDPILSTCCPPSSFSSSSNISRTTALLFLGHCPFLSHAVAATHMLADPESTSMVGRLLPPAQRKRYCYLRHTTRRQLSSPMCKGQLCWWLNLFFSTGARTAFSITLKVSRPVSFRPMVLNLDASDVLGLLCIYYYLFYLFAAFPQTKAVKAAYNIKRNRVENISWD